MDFMDLNSVYMVRSAKGVDMLCVDDFLYHYDGRGRSNTYRWLCNRRKDKHTPCRSRITTVLANPRDRSVHVVQEVSGNHTHPRCSDHEITKVSERKRLANLQGQPCTLDLKHKSRKSAPLPKFVRLPVDSEQPRKRPRLDAASDTAMSPERSSLNKTFDFEDTERVYVLRRQDGRIMCCVDGQLYYLDGKSRKMELYRWICVRKRDVSCTAMIYTEPTIEGAHRLSTIESDAHIHPHYSPNKLLHMFAKHNITVLDDEQVEEALGGIAELNLFDTVQCINDSMEAYDAYEEDEEESIIIEEYGGDDYQVIVDEDDNATTEVIVQSIPKKWPRSYDVVEHYVPPSGYDPLTESSLEKFSFLPSAKGKKVLCLNQNLYHYDSQSKANGYLFWTCIMRRNSSVNCHVRVTMDPTVNGPVIVRTSGQHNHPMRVDDIRRRLKRQRELTSEFYNDSQADNNYISGMDDDSNGSNTIDYTNISEHLNDFLPTPATSSPMTTGDLQNMVQNVKKVIDIDGIKMEPTIDDSEEHTPMVVEYCNDGSAKIEIPAEVLQKDAAEASKPFSPNNRNIKNEQQEEEGEKNKNKSLSLSPDSLSGLESDMDLTKICKLRSAKGSEMLCVDGYIYHAKNKGLISRSYWVCIKARDPELNCKSRVSTATQKDGSIRVLRVYNRHSHAVNEADIKRRLYNEINKKANKKLKFKPLHFIEKSLDQINAEYGDLAIERLKVSNISQDVVVHKPLRISGSRDKSNTTTDQEDQSTNVTTRYQHRQRLYQKEFEEQIDQETEAALSIMEISAPLIEDQEQIIIDQEIDEDYAAIETIMPTEEDAIIEEVGEIVEYDSVLPVYSMKLYAVSDGPPSLAVRMTLRALQIQYQLINVDFCALEHLSEDYAKLNPQKEIPVLDDDGFLLSESIAIMQYLCDKYAPDSTLYPQETNTRAVINQRLCFNMGFYYAPISAHSMAPIFFDYERTPMSLKKVQNALDVFETYLQRTGTKYAASDDLTIADFGLVSATLCLEAIGFDMTQYPLVNHWYNTFKEEYPELWEIANSGLEEIKEFEKNPPDLSHMDHPFHPTRKVSS